MYLHVSQFGIFDSEVKFPKMTISQMRPVEEYELELYADEAPGQTCLNGNWYALSQGTCVVAKPGSTRRSRLPFRCYYIHLQTDDDELCSLLQDLPECFVLWQMQELLGLFNQMLTAESAATAEDRLLVNSCTLQIIRHLVLQQKTAANIKTERVSLHQKALLSVDRYIRENRDQELSLNFLAAYCNLSPTYFHSVFTEFFQKTPAQYILACRIAAAKTGLLVRDYSLSALAADCGFSSQSYFCYKFRKITGMTPLEYRAKQLGKLKL